MIDLAETLDALDEDARMVRDAAADWSARDPEYKRVRSLRGQMPSCDRAVWQELAQMGWTACRVPEAQGGTPLSTVQWALLFQQFGRSLAPEPLAATAVLSTGLLSNGPNAALRDRWLPAVAEGRALLATAWQTVAGHQQAFQADGCIAEADDANHWRLRGKLRFVAGGEDADAFIVAALAPDGPMLAIVERGAAGLRAEHRPRIDGGWWTELSFDDLRVSSDAVLLRGDAAPVQLDRALDETRLAVAAELNGLMAQLFEITVAYLKTREQFGAKIGSFQALQHQAVDLLLQVEISRASLLECARRVDDAGNDALVLAKAASQAKARASDAAMIVTKGCLQLHGGIAYTDESNVGLFLKRAMVLSAWLGDAAFHRRRYGELAEQQSAVEPHTDAEAHDAAAAGAEDGSSDTLQAFRRWLHQSFPPQWRFPVTRQSLKETESWRMQLAEKGWSAPGLPKEVGGMGLSPFDQIRLQNEYDQHGVSIAPNMGVTMLGPLLLRYGTDEQKARWLPGILSGRTHWCQGYSEPGAGSDLASLRTRAELQGDHFVVNGQKIWTSFAHEADMIFLLVRTDPQAKKQSGISFLLVDMKTPGITVRRIRNITGESEFCEVFFDDVRVPRENLVGEPNQGWKMAKALLGSERIMIGNPRLARYPLNLLRSWMIAHGKFDDPVLRARFDALRLDVDDLGDAFARMADVLRRGGELGAEVSILKIWISEAAQRVTDLMLACGAEDATVDVREDLPDGGAVHLAQQFFMARPTTIYGGSNEIQRNILSRAVLDLPG